MTMIKYVEHLARALIRHNTEFTSAVKKVAHTRLPSIGFQSWSRLLTVSLETWVINPAVGCQYFPPGPQFKIQILRSRWKSVEKCLYRASRWTDTSKTMHSVANRIGKSNKDTVRISSSKMSTDYQQQQLPFNGLWSGTTRVGRYQKKHSPTHTHPDHRASFIIFLHLQQFITVSVCISL